MNDMEEKLVDNAITFQARGMRESILAAVNDAKKAVNNRASLPVLLNVLLRGEDATLDIYGTNLEMAIKASAPVQSASGAITVPAKAFYDAIKAQPKNSVVTLEGSQESTKGYANQTIVKAKLVITGATTMTLHAIEAEEFPVVPDAPAPTTRITAADLSRILTNAGVAASRDMVRPILTGILLRMDGKRVTAVAADNYRISIDEADLLDAVETSELANPAYVIPVENMDTLVKILPKGDVPIDMALARTKNQMTFAWPGRLIVSRLIDGQFPNYQQVIPVGEFDVTADFSRTALVDAVKSAALVAQQAANVVKYTFNGAIKITAVADDNVYDGSVPAEVTGETSIALNAKYVTDIGKLAIGDELRWELRGPLMPSVFTSGTWKYVVMPVRTPS